MLKLGIIGTSWISHEFITAAHQTGHYHLQAVYSRKMKTAQEFCEPYGAISCYTDFIDFLDSELDWSTLLAPILFTSIRPSLLFWPRNMSSLKNRP